MRVDLKTLLTEYCAATPDMMKEKTISSFGLTITQIRDKLYMLGNILHEDLDNQVYVASVHAGVANLSSAIVVLQLIGNRIHIMAYAKEGLIKQNTCEQAIQKIANAAAGKTDPKKPRSRWLFPALVTILVLTAFVIIRYAVIDRPNTEQLGDNLLDSIFDKNTEPTEDPAFVAEVHLTIEATREYNKAAEQYNLHVAEYNEAVLYTCIDNINGLPASIEQISLESESYEDNAEVVQGANTKEKIAADTALIRELTTQVESLTQVLRQITAPTGEWVADRLGNVDGITGCGQVTEQQNPDGLLGKEGGYAACVYFSHSAIKQNEIPGSNIVAKGTDAGGAVEIYATLEEAQARVEYLAGFDGTILYSGSYAIVGTTVIRTSYKLTDEQQLALTHAITMALTVVENN